MMEFLFVILEFSGLWKNTVVWPHDAPLVSFHNRKPDWLEGELWIYPGISFVFQDYGIYFRASFELPWWLRSKVQIDGKWFYPHEVELTSN